MFNNLKMRWKLLAGFSIVIILTLAMSVVSFFELSNVDKIYDNVLKSPVIGDVSMLNIGRTYARYRRLGVTAVLGSSDTEALNTLTNEYHALQTNMDAFFKTII